MQTFKKDERLSGKKKIDELFSLGKSFNVNPFRVIWLNSVLNTVFPAQILITVPKRHFKKAVDRNLIKRRIREAYRKNKGSFYEYLKAKDVNLVLALIYTSAEMASYNEIEEKIILILQRLQSKYEKDFG